MHPRFIVVKKLGEELTIFNTLSVAIASEARSLDRIDKQTPDIIESDYRLPI